jgi:hypothetical protein
MAEENENKAYPSDVLDTLQEGFELGNALGLTNKWGKVNAYTVTIRPKDAPNDDFLVRMTTRDYNIAKFICDRKHTNYLRAQVSAYGKITFTPVV